MNPNTYQDATKQTEIYTDAAEQFLRNAVEDNVLDRSAVEMLSAMYCGGKLAGEAGEVDELIFKEFRGNGSLTDAAKEKLFYELGDIMWYVARIADLAGHRLGDIMLANIEKLQDRKNRGVLHGYGDDR